MPGRGTGVRTGAPTPGRRLPTPLSYLAVYRASPLERISMIKRGVRATDAKHVIADLSIAQGTALKALNLSQATVNKKAKQGQTLSPDESERVIGLARLVGQLEAIVEESGNAQGFDATEWMSRWLNEPLAARGGGRSARWTPWRAKPWCPPQPRRCRAGLRPSRAVWRLAADTLAYEGDDLLLV